MKNPPFWISALVGTLSFSPCATAQMPSVSRSVSPHTPYFVPPMFEKQDRGFITHGLDYALKIEANRTQFLLPLKSGKTVPLTIDLIGANPNASPSTDKTPVVPSRRYCSFKGHVQSTEASLYERVRFPQAYPGIDLIYYGQGKKLEYDFVVAPGASPSRIRFRSENTQGVRLAKNGDLLLKTVAGEARWKRPVIYQTVNGKRVPVSGGYRLKGTGQVGFAVGTYRKNLPLIIDPVVDFSTYLGGSDYEYANAVSTDGKGNLYVIGQTYSFDFPTVNAIQATKQGNWDAYAARFSANGKPAYITYFGGSAFDGAYNGTVDKNGNSYFTGITESNDFPVTANAFQRTLGGSRDAFVVKLASNGSLIYSTYYGQDAYQWAEALALAGDGSVYIGGYTNSYNLPGATGGYQPTHSDWSYWNGYIAHLSADGSSVVGATYLRGTTYWAKESHIRSLTVDPSGNVIALGNTENRDMPVTANALQSTKAGASFYRSTNSGTAWTGLDSISNNSSNLYYMALSPTSPNTMLGISNSGLYRTTDGGVNWNFTGIYPWMNGVNFDPTNTNRAYISIYNGIYKTTNAGVNWVRKGISGVNNPICPVVSPVNPNIVFLGCTNTLYRSTDYGENWTALSTNLPKDNNNNSQINWLTFNSTGTTLYAATQYGMYSSSDGITWTPRNSGLPLYDNGTPRAIFQVVISPVNNNYLYCIVDNNRQVYRSINGGNSWTATNATGVNWVTPTNNLNTFHIATGNGIWRTTNAGGSFTRTQERFDAQVVLANPQDNTKVVSSGWTQWDGYLAKLSSDLKTLMYATYLGGSYYDFFERAAVDPEGNFYAIGSSQSTNIPKKNPMQGTIQGWADVFLAKFSPDGTPIYATYFGGSDSDYGNMGVADRFGNLWFTGQSFSFDLPTTANALQPLQPENPTNSGTAFLFRLTPDGQRITYGSYLGGTDNDWERNLAVDDNGRVYFAGSTYSVDFPIWNSFQGYALGGAETFVGRMTLKPGITTTLATDRLNDGNIQVQVRVQNTGELDLAPLTLNLGKLGTRPALETLPITFPRAMIGEDHTFTLTFPGTGIAPGTFQVLKITGAYSGGTFGGTYRLRMP